MFQVLLLTVLFFSRASGQVIDLSTGQEAEGSYLESGFITLTSTDTISISTTNTFTNPVLYLSTVFSTDGYSDEIPLEPRVVNLVDNAGSDAVVSFDITLIWPSNKTCVSEWNDGAVPQGSYTVGWYVGETGGYTVSGIQMEFVTATVNALEWNLATWPYPFGTDCNYPTQNGDDDYSPGALFTLQSNNNAGQFLSVRASSWFKTEKSKCDYGWAGGHMRLYPHDFIAEAGLIDLQQIQDETVGVFLFDTRFPQSLDCVGGNYLEIGQVNGLTSSPLQLSMYQPVDTSTVNIGVFGSVLTLEGGDSMMIKSYALSSSPTDIFSFMQEDKCADSETIHYPETFSYFLSTPTTNTDCDGTAPILGEHTFSPTVLPTLHPTNLPTKLPTVDEGEGGSGDDAGSAKSGDILLAVFLPICIIVVVAIVGVVTKKVFLTPAAGGDDSEHSGLNLVP